MWTFIIIAVIALYFFPVTNTILSICDICIETREIHIFPIFGLVILMLIPGFQYFTIPAIDFWVTDTRSRMDYKVFEKYKVLRVLYNGGIHPFFRNLGKSIKIMSVIKLDSSNPNE